MMGANLFDLLLFPAHPRQGLLRRRRQSTHLLLHPAIDTAGNPGVAPLNLRSEHERSHGLQERRAVLTLLSEVWRLVGQIH